MNMIKYPKTPQFKDINTQMHHDFPGELPVIEFIGTVKLHGTNAAIGFTATKDGSKDTEFFCQSRSNVLTDKDNYGFAAACKVFAPTLISYINVVYKDIFIEGNTYVIYGEWAGRGIQDGVGISMFNRAFYVFGLYDADEDKWLPILDELGTSMGVGPYNIQFLHNIHTFKVTVDFNNPAAATHEMTRLTLQVEERDPIVERMVELYGTEVDSYLGEGIVWTATHPKDGSRLCFKTKGKKHTDSNVKVLIPIDEEKMANKIAIVLALITPVRCDKAIEYLKEQGLDPADIRNMGTYLKWVNGDVAAEESNFLAANGTSMKEMGSMLSRAAREYWIQKYKA